MILYDHPLSGNCYKVRLLLAHLKRPYERVSVDVLGDRTQRPAEFFEQNPAGKIPLLVLDDGRCLAESNAIMSYLARDTDYLPDDAFVQAQVLQWMFFEQNQHETSIAARRYWVSIAESSEPAAALLPAWSKAGDRALEVMEQHLRTRDFFVGERYSIADIALYAYTHVASEGEFDLEPLPAVRSWLRRVAAQPGHVRIEDGADASSAVT